MALHHKVIITANQQIPVQSPEGVSINVSSRIDPTIMEVSLQIDEEEYVELQRLAVTNDIPADILMANMDERTE